MGDSKMTRRRFVRGTVATALAGLSAPSLRAAQVRRLSGANDRIRLGIVGPGIRGRTLVSWIQQLAVSENVAISAVCDIWHTRREALADELDARNNLKVHRCHRMEEACSLKDVDALVIATPDFQHAPQTRQAVEAGKDVYVEKPFGCDFEQIRLARDAVLRTGRIVQHGTQRRGQGIPWAARDFVRSGRLGKVSFVEITQALFHQRWRIPSSESTLTANDTDWGEFLSYTPQVPFNSRHYLEYRLFWPYSTGIFCQWMSHAIDLVNLVLGERPKSVVAAGGVYVWSDGRTNPDTVQCLVEYPSGCMVSYHMRLGNGANGRWVTFYGTRGTLDLEAGMAYGDGGGGEVVLRNPGASIPEFVIDGARRLPGFDRGGVLLDAEPDRDHMADFFAAVRSRRRPRAPIESAFDQAVATTMAGMSLRMGAKVSYDPVADAVFPTHAQWDRMQQAARERRDSATHGDDPT